MLTRRQAVEVAVLVAASGRPLASRPPPLACGFFCQGPSQSQPHHLWNETAVVAINLSSNVQTVSISLARSNFPKWVL